MRVVLHFSPLLSSSLLFSPLLSSSLLFSSSPLVRFLTLPSRILPVRPYVDICDNKVLKGDLMSLLEELKVRGSKRLGETMIREMTIREERLDKMKLVV